MSSKSLALVLVVLLCSSVVAGVVAADAGANLTVRPAGDGTAEYAATAGVGPDSVGSLESFEMHLGETGVTLPKLPPEAVVKAGIDRGDDRPGTAVDVSVEGDVEGVSVVDGDTLTVFFDGTTEVHEGDEVVVVLRSVPTLPAGTTTVPVGVNAPTERALVNATVTIADAAAESPEANGSGGDTTDSGVEATDTDTDAVGVTSSPVPGFGVAPAVLALASAAVVAARASARRR